MGKGDGRRPRAISAEEERERWERTFKKPERQPAPEKPSWVEAVTGTMRQFDNIDGSRYKVWGKVAKVDHGLTPSITFDDSATTDPQP